MSKILVLGAGGMAGSMIHKYLTIQNHDVTGWFRTNFDVLKDELPDLSSYDYVINCIGLIKQKSDNSDLLYKLNAEFPKKLALKHNKVIHISSDCVFSGKLNSDEKYFDWQNPDSEDDYGKSKAEGEKINAMVLRTSIIGPSKDDSGLFEWLRATKQNRINGFYNHLWSGITTLELAKIIDTIISNKGRYNYGIFQLAANSVYKYELLHFINSIFNLKKNIVPYFSEKSINRSLVPFDISKNIALQLHELKEFIEQTS